MTTAGFRSIQLQDMGVIKLLISCILAGSLLLAQTPKAKTEAAAHVVLAEKDWSVSGRAIARGTSLSAQDVLSGTANATALILECGQAGWLVYECGAQPCRIPVCATKVDGVRVQRSDPGGASNNRAESGRGVLTSRVAPESRTLFDTLFRRQPKDPVTLGVRSGGNASDALVLQNAQGIHWGPALNRILEGRHCFRLSSIPAAGPVLTFSVDWDRSLDPEGVARVPMASAGLYEIVKGVPGSGGNCPADPDAAAAWVLVAPEPDFPRISADWKNDAAWFSQLEQSGSDPSVVATVRHAVLAYLADSLRSK
ncbi:MAG: hypothetical protein JWO19_4823 [Bryobacterales bacterium]|nr:hypothetical protein [Bryobacterales bacterium]